MSSSTKELFLRFAFPCKESEELLKNVKEKKELPVELLMREFPYAMSKLISKAMEKGKVESGEIVIDDDIVMSYFTQDHASEAVPDECKVWKGKLIEIKGNVGKVKYEKGEKEIKLDLLKEEEKKVGNEIYFHYNYACYPVSS